MHKIFYTERTLIKRNSKKFAKSIRAKIRERVEIRFGVLTMLHFLLWHSFEYILWHFFFRDSLTLPTLCTHIHARKTIKQCITYNIQTLNIHSELSPMYTYCILYTVHCILYYTLYNVWCIIYIIHYTVYCIHYTYSLDCAVYTVQCTVYTLYEVYVDQSHKII